ncbi:MAG: hypothetical protein MUO76_01860 [Anaerolineaceae bacterium]|nr:hypothetical protein [Anaerolineaceae bacterium]
MIDKEALKTEIRLAFSNMQFPGRGNITNSYESDEAASMETEFGDKKDWTALEADFLDHAPDGFASAPSFFSSTAFRFYLPAYLIADIDDKLEHVNVVFHLYHGLDETSRAQLINPRRYGNRNWFDYVTERFGSFSSQQAAAVVGYLEFKLNSGYLAGFEQENVRQALANFWQGRVQRGRKT